MNEKARAIVLVVGVGGIFAAGAIFGGTFFTKDDPSGGGRGAGKAPHPERASAFRPRTGAPPVGTSAESSIVERIRAARVLPEGERTGQLLRALEQSTKSPLTRELMNELRSILDGGDVTSAHCVLSLMEQREEKASVDFLVEASAHPDPEIAERALFALEAVAGAVFKTRGDAVAWASTWNPAPDRARLFSPAQGGRADESPASPPREMAPDKARARVAVNPP